MRALGISKIAVFYLGVGAVGLLGVLGRGGVADLFPGAHWGLWLIQLAGGVGMGLLLVLASRMATFRFAWAQRLAHELRCVIGELSAREALILACLSAVGEELLFRGVLQPALGLWIAALVFGVLHTGPNRHFLPWTGMAAVAGVAFGLLYLWTGNLLAPMLAHGTVNYLNLKHLCAPRGALEINLGPAARRGLAEP